MILPITKSAKEFGYIIWSAKTDAGMHELLGNATSVSITINGLSIGKKPISWKYHRISLGYKFTRAFPDTATQYELSRNGEYLEVQLK